MIFLFVNIVSAGTLTTLYSDRGNVNPDYSVNSTIILIYSGSLVFEKPSTFSFDDKDTDCTISENNATCTDGNSWVRLTTPSTCTEGTTYEAKVFVDNALKNSTKFVCINDSNIVSLKQKLGHGEKNMLNTLFVPADEDILIFNMIQVFEYSSYFSDEKGVNAFISCNVPNELIRTSQFTTTCQDTCTINKTWTELDTQLFRLGVLSQEVNLNIGESYFFNCTELSYNISNSRIVASLGNVSLEAVNSTALDIVVYNNKSDLIYEINNTKSYDIYDVFLSWSNSQTKIYSTFTLNKLKAGQIINFTKSFSGSGNMTIDIKYIPDWYKESWARKYKIQSFNTDYSPTTATTLSSTGSGWTSTPKTDVINLSYSIVTSDESWVFGRKYLVLVDTFSLEGVHIDVDKLNINVIKNISFQEGDTIRTDVGKYKKAFLIEKQDNLDNIAIEIIAKQSFKEIKNYTYVSLKTSDFFDFLQFRAEGSAIKTESFIEDNLNIIIYSFLALIVVFILFIILYRLQKN